MQLLTDIRYIQHLLGKDGLSPREASGQNFLISPEVVEATVLALKGGPKKVTELGSGLGALTQGLTLSGFEVRAIEHDRNLIAILEKILSPSKYPNLKMIEGDLRETSWEHSTPYQVAGNIPYNLSGLIFRRLTQLSPEPERVVLLVQKEVAQRVVARPPDMNLLALTIALWGDSRILLDVPRHCFWPAPEVQSALLLIVPFSPNARPIEAREALIKTAKVFFQGKRKQIGGMIRRHWHKTPEELNIFEKESNISLSARPENLSVDQWEKIHNFLAVNA